VRVVSLVPSVTETLLAWHVDVVACTRFCEQPALPHVGGTKDPDLDAIASLHPDLVVMDREENRREDAEALAALGVALHVTHVVDVDDVAPALTALAERLGIAPRRSEVLAGRSTSRRCRAFVPIWRRPWMALGRGTYGASLLAMLGVDVVTAQPDDRYPTVDLADVAVLRPDLVLAPSEPYPFRDRHLVELGAAFPGTSVVAVDGRDLFWWGVRTPGALVRLGAQLDAIGS
jgi:ABC-type Fe3+-hydroxamate transport system substrate-binding protein